MKYSTLIALSLLITPGIAISSSESDRLIVKPAIQKENTISKVWSSEDKTSLNPNMMTRSRPYPTQIVRISGELVNSKKRCPAIFKELENFFMKHLPYTDFYYITLTNCGYDPKTNYAVNFSIDSYFDPMNDSAIDHLEEYLSTHNGADLLGTKFIVESAKGLAVSLNVDAGMSQHNDEVLLRYRHDNQSHYFASNYEMIHSFHEDVYDRFYSTEPDKVLPFMVQWFASSSDTVYNRALRQSNLVLLQPERIFLMDTAPEIYSCPLRMYYAHHCDKTPEERCLGTN